MARFVIAVSVEPQRMMLGLLVISAPWLVLAAVQAIVRSAWPTALSALPWLIVAVLLSLSGGRAAATMWLFPLAVAFWGWLSVRRAARGEPAYLEPTP